MKISGRGYNPPSRYALPMAKDSRKPAELASIIATQALRHQGIPPGQVLSARDVEGGRRVVFSDGLAVSVSGSVIDSVSKYPGTIAGWLTSKEGQRAALSIRGSLVRHRTLKQNLSSPKSSGLAKKRTASDPKRKSAIRLRGKRFAEALSVMFSAVIKSKPNTPWENSQKCASYLFSLGCRVNYLEGFAVKADDNHSKPFEHAWCELSGITIDITLHEVNDYRYFPMAKYSGREIIAASIKRDISGKSKGEPLFWDYSDFGKDNQNWIRAKGKAEGHNEADAKRHSKKSSAAKDTREKQYRKDLGKIIKVKTFREIHLEVSRIIGAGFPELLRRHRDASNQSGISVGDVSKHRARLFSKLFIAADKDLP